MGKLQYIQLTECLSAGLLKAFKAHVTGREPAFVELPDEGELSLFADTDSQLGRGNGYFRFDEEECQSRRLDMRTELDRDPGPIEMEEAPFDDDELDNVIEFEPVPTLRPAVKRADRRVRVTGA